MHPLVDWPGDALPHSRAFLPQIYFTVVKLWHRPSPTRMREMTQEPTDPRWFRSRQALIAAMTQLLDERDLAEISITDLVQRASVSRPTFYQHFADLNGLARL